MTKATDLKTIFLKMNEETRVTLQYLFKQKKLILIFLTIFGIFLQPPSQAPKLLKLSVYRLTFFNELALKN